MNLVADEITRRPLPNLTVEGGLDIELWRWLQEVVEWSGKGPQRCCQQSMDL